MFKVKLIENNRYYLIRIKLFVLFVAFFSVPIGTLFFAKQLPIWLIALIVFLFLFFLYLMAKNHRLLNSLVGKRNLVITDKIEIFDNNDKLIKSIAFSDIEKIIVCKQYGIPQETIKDIARDFKGDKIKNYIEVCSGEERQRFDFEFDSYYMQNILDEVINDWLEKGIIIELV